MRIQVVSTTNQMPEGNYTGKIVYQSISKDNRYLWLNVEVDGYSSLLNISISLASNLLNNFAMNFADEQGDVDTEDFVDTRISFTLFNKEYDEKIFSKFSSLEPIFEEEDGDLEW